MTMTCQIFEDDYAILNEVQDTMPQIVFDLAGQVNPSSR